MQYRLTRVLFIGAAFTPHHAIGTSPLELAIISYEPCKSQDSMHIELC